MITSDLTTDSSNPVERALEEFRKQVLEPCEANGKRTSAVFTPDR